MIVAQISDLHLGFDRDNPAEFNRKRLDRVLAALSGMNPMPDLLFATGDLVERGDVASYRRLREALAHAPCPVWLCTGNHDVRANLLRVFPDVPACDGFIHYAVDAGPLRFIVLDTLEEGRHGGAFCDARAAWLRERLAEAPDRPTIILLHHPPVETGIGWMTTSPAEPWVERLGATLAGSPQVLGLLCGHIHRPMVAAWSGVPVVVCPSTAPQVALDLSAIDPDTPDHRAMIVAEPPGFALHHWTGTALVTHFQAADEPVVLARFDPAMQPLVRRLALERASG